jgi:hypothetical protein
VFITRGLDRGLIEQSLTRFLKLTSAWDHSTSLDEDLPSRNRPAKIAAIPPM